jgi:hypothetical protein
MVSRCMISQEVMKRILSKIPSMSCHPWSGKVEASVPDVDLIVFKGKVTGLQVRTTGLSIKGISEICNSAWKQI